MVKGLHVSAGLVVKLGPTAVFDTGRGKQNQIAPAKELVDVLPYRSAALDFGDSGKPIRSCHHAISSQATFPNLPPWNYFPRLRTYGSRMSVVIAFK